MNISRGLFVCFLYLKNTFGFTKNCCVICKFILFFSNNEQSKDDTMWSKDKRYDEDSKGLIDEKVSIFIKFFSFLFYI